MAGSVPSLNAAIPNKSAIARQVKSSLLHISRLKSPKPDIGKTGLDPQRLFVGANSCRSITFHSVAGEQCGGSSAL